MADNTSQTGTATIAADDVTTLNGGASSGVLVQRVKVGYGDDGTHRDASAAFPLPVNVPDTTGSGTITTTDAVVAAPAGAGALVSGASTAGSLVSLACPGGDSAWNMQITGLTSGTLYFEESLDSTNGTDGNWINVNGRQTGIVNTVLAGNATTNGVYRGNTSGAKYIRIRSVGTLTGTPAIQIRLSSGPGAMFLNASVPAGTNAIGTVDVRGTALTSATGNIAAAGTGTIGPLDVSRAGNVTIVAKNQTAATAWAGAPVLVFEQSDDNTSWSPLTAVRNDTMQAGSTFTLAANSANTEIVWDAAAEAINYVRVRVTTGPTTNPMTVTVYGGGLAFSPIVAAAVTPVSGATVGTASGTIGTARVTGTATAASTALVSAPGAGLSIYVTDIVASNSGGTLTVVGLLPAAGTNVYDLPLAASGGGATINLRTPWKLAANTALNYTVSAATTSWFITVNFYTAP